jgi:DNA-binding Lrp family transcriptional regulator
MAQGWTFVSNHGHVLVALATEPDVLLRDVAERVGITERAVQQIVADLERAGYLTRQRVGRRNRYAVREDLPFRHPLEAGVPVGAFLDLVRSTAASARVAATAPGAPARRAAEPGGG